MEIMLDYFNFVVLVAAVQGVLRARLSRSRRRLSEKSKLLACGSRSLSKKKMVEEGLVSLGTFLPFFSKNVRVHSLVKQYCSYHRPLIYIDHLMIMNFFFEHEAI